MHDLPLPWLVVDGVAVGGLICVYRRAPNPGVDGAGCSPRGYDVELDCSSVVLPRGLHQMQDMYS